MKNCCKVVITTKCFMKRIFCAIKVFIMHYTVDFSMRHYARFLQIGLHTILTRIYIN